MIRIGIGFQNEVGDTTFFLRHFRRAAAENGYEVGEKGGMYELDCPASDSKRILTDIMMTMKRNMEG